MLSITMDYLTQDQEVTVVRQSTGAKKVELKKVIGGEDLVRFAAAVRSVKLPPELGKYIVDLVASSRAERCRGAGLRQRVRVVGRRLACEPEHRAGEQERRRAGRPRYGVDRRHPPGHRARAAASNRPGVQRRRRSRDAGDFDRSVVEGRPRADRNARIKKRMSRRSTQMNADQATTTEFSYLRSSAFICG